MPVILVVDDNRGMVETLDDILTTRGYEVAWADSGEAAVAKLAEGRCDVVLMDIQMPGLNGVDTLKTMKRLAPDVRVIMMTAYTRHELVEEARRASALAILSKPLDIEQTISLIDSVAGCPGT